jgi:hypothetical protein
MLRKVLAALFAGLLVLSTVGSAFADIPPGQQGYEGVPGNQGVPGGDGN